MSKKYSAALIIIGDEILRGDVIDTNTSYLAKSLRNKGFKLQRVVVIPDEVNDIANEISEMSKNFSIVFTSGGVGPTHDDVTYESVAQGLGLQLEENSELVKLLNKNLPSNQQNYHHVRVPSPCDLIHVTVKDDIYAVLKAENVYVLPGSPNYFRPAVDKIISGLKKGIVLYNESIDVTLNEYSIVDILNDQASRWNGIVSIGSYPQQGTLPLTRITLEGNEENVLKVKKELVSLLSAHLELHATFTTTDARKIYESISENDHIKTTIEILEKCFELYKADEVFLSFNGGKDCTVVLHLAAAVIRMRCLKPLICLYVTGDTFSEVDEFVDNAAKYYGFNLIKKERPMQSALGKLLEEQPALQASLLGMRKNDPGSETLKPFAPTDPGWPKIMRVSPILDWTYNQVWKFLLKHNVNYCPLYDQGYTSIGAKSTTLKNSLLQNPNDPFKYLPAHSLLDDSTERHGRG